MTIRGSGLSSAYFDDWQDPYSCRSEFDHRHVPYGPRQQLIYNPFNRDDRLYYPQIGFEYGGQYSRTNHYMRLSGWQSSITTASMTTVAELATHNHPLAVVTGASLEFAQRYRHLNDGETAVFDVLRRLNPGGSIYRVWVTEEELLAAMDPDLDLDGRRRLLANMASRGLLEEGAGKWRAVF